MTDDNDHPIFGLNLLDPECSAVHRQHMADLMALLELHSKFHLILTSSEHDSLLRAIGQLGESLAIPFETFGLTYKTRQ